jgi:hypothetical protein
MVICPLQQAFRVLPDPSGFPTPNKCFGSKTYSQVEEVLT